MNISNENFDLNTIEPFNTAIQFKSKKTIQATAEHSKILLKRFNVLEPDKNHGIILIWQQRDESTRMWRS